MFITAETPMLSELIQVLARAPSPDKIMAIQASDEEEERLAQLMEKQDALGLSYEEERELDMFLIAEHLVELAKIEAYLRMRS